MFFVFHSRLIHINSRNLWQSCLWRTFLIIHCSDKYKTQRLCDKAADDTLAALKLIPDCLVTKKNDWKSFSCFVVHFPKYVLETILKNSSHKVFMSFELKMWKYHISMTSLDQNVSIVFMNDINLKIFKTIQHKNYTWRFAIIQNLWWVLAIFLVWLCAKMY